jgi:2-polyprenyl-3-methyl-5-hydroxy-6-metoxy-1,4-benzoquinol methylase
VETMPERQYDDLYSKHDGYFGEHPDQILVDYCDLIDKRKPVLDIGAGQGRHSLYLAERSIPVDAIDNSIVAIEHLAQEARRREVMINTCHFGFADLRAKPASYSAVLLFGLVQLLRREEIDDLINKIQNWLIDDGLVFLLAFLKDDASYERFSKGKQIGRNSFINENGTVRTFLESNEVLGLFDGFEVIHHWEGMGPLHQHADNPPEQHSEVHAVLRNRSR